MEKEYRVSREGSTQGMYFSTDKGLEIAKHIGRIMWINRYGKSDDITIQQWKPRLSKIHNTLVKSGNDRYISFIDDTNGITYIGSKRDISKIVNVSEKTKNDRWIYIRKDEISKYKKELLKSKQTFMVIINKDNIRETYVDGIRNRVIGM